MGMFDYLKINIDKIPLSEEERKLYADKLEFQTKDFECILSEAIITDEGELYFKNFDGLLEPTNHRTEKINHHGYIYFYDYIDNICFDFRAKFTDGKLICIERL